MRWTVAEAAAACGATVHGNPATEFSSIVNDSRLIQDGLVGDGGQMFVALRAERDGHDFVADAFRAGATIALVDHDLVVPDTLLVVPDTLLVVPDTLLVVPDTLLALAALGRAARARLLGPVVGITGSVGKTSTKDLLVGIARMVGTVNASARSHNNEVGVPITLCGAQIDADLTVLEMGARRVGDIRHLCEIGRPDIGVVTAVAAAHTEIFGGIEAIIQAKGEMVEALDSAGTAVLRADQPDVAAMSSRTSASVVTFGDGGDVRATGVVLDDALRPRFRLESPWGAIDVALSVAGRHNVGNALAAAAVALVTGVALDGVAAGLATSELSPHRMAVVTGPSGARLIDDSYNANPESMRAAIRALVELPARRRVAVLGFMAEQGEDGPAAHRAIAELLDDRGVELLAVGTDLYGPEPVSLDEAVARLADLAAGDVVLIKGSRVAGLERISERLLAG